jgi:hypothetical protein
MLSDTAGYMPLPHQGHRAERRDTARVWRGTAVLTAAFCLGFQFFFSSNYPFDNHPLAPVLLMEAVYGLLIAFAVALVVKRAVEGTLTRIDLFFLLMPALLMFLSALFAFVSFGQPLIFGIGEDRRALSFLFWFVYDPVCRRYGLTQRDIVRALVACAAIYLALSLAIQTMMPADLLARDIPDLDTRKLRITSPGECFAICFLLGIAVYAVTGRVRDLVPAAIGLAGLLLVAQTRQTTLVSLAVAAASMLVLRPGTTLKIGLVAGFALLVFVTLLDSNPLLPILEFVAPNLEEFSGAHLSENPRSVTFSIVMKLLSENFFMGIGGVSILYDGGLQRIYGKHFWINDVGIFGEVFRIGFVWIVFMVAYLYVAFNEWVRMRDRALRAAIASIVIFFLIQSLSAGFLFRHGYVHAFVFLVMMAPAGMRMSGVRGTS